MGLSLENIAYKKETYAHLKGTVVIDAGHGGNDTGAIGKTGLSEKKVTLDVALRIKRLIKNFAPKVKVILTREKDEYVSLKKRIEISNKAKADLFISVHVNSSTDSSAKGFEVYSLDVANDEYSAKLAKKENHSFGKEQNDAAFILADLRANSNRKESDILAFWIDKGISSQMNKLNPDALINKRGYNQGLFYVLFGKSPAVLIELFFISNKNEEKKLKEAGFREASARGISLGIFKYLYEKNKGGK